MESKGINFLENELIKKAQAYGCHTIELLKSEKDPSHVVGIGYWNDIEDARKFQAQWNSKEQELLTYCINKPEREFYKLGPVYSEKAKKAA